jgi:peptidoglycan/xylan/chitin deacetylase (PgdA/CDA1 family)
MKLLPLRSKLIVLLYHRIAAETSDPWSLCVTPEHFVEHLEVLQRFRRLPLSRLEPSGYPLFGEPEFVITFDDGYSDNARVAAPLLRRYDTPATFFIATGYVGGAIEYWWDELERIIFEGAPLPPSFTAVVNGRMFSWQIPPDRPRAETYNCLYEQLQPLAHETRRSLLNQLADLCGPVSQARSARRPMTLDELWTMALDPLFEIGAHTMMHPLLAARPVEEQHTEIRGSKSFLEQQLELQIRSFSYPYGGRQHYLPATVAAVRECGFTRACTTGGYPVRHRDGPFEISRQNVTDMDGDAFLKFLQLA